MEYSFKYVVGFPVIVYRMMRWYPAIVQSSHGIKILDGDDAVWYVRSIGGDGALRRVKESEMRPMVANDVKSNGKPYV